MTHHQPDRPRVPFPTDNRIETNFVYAMIIVAAVAASLAMLAVAIYLTVGTIARFAFNAPLNLLPYESQDMAFGAVMLIAAAAGLLGFLGLSLERRAGPPPIVQLDRLTRFGAWPGLPVGLVLLGILWIGLALVATPARAPALGFQVIKATVSSYAIIAVALAVFLLGAIPRSGQMASTIVAPLGLTWAAALATEQSMGGMLAYVAVPITVVGIVSLALGLINDEEPCALGVAAGAGALLAAFVFIATGVVTPAELVAVMAIPLLLLAMILKFSFARNPLAPRLARGASEVAALVVAFSVIGIMGSIVGLTGLDLNALLEGVGGTAFWILIAALTVLSALLTPLLALALILPFAVRLQALGISPEVILPALVLAGIAGLFLRYWIAAPEKTASLAPPAVAAFALACATPWLLPAGRFLSQLVGF